MSKDKKGGGKKTGGKQGGGKKKTPLPPDPQDCFIEFTPSGGFDIRAAARNFSELMEQLDQSLVIHLPHVSVEFEPGCTPQEIVDGYNMALSSKFELGHSNANTKETEE